MADEKRSFYRLDVHVWCTPDQLTVLENSIINLLCPNLDHDGPCEIPWYLDPQDELLEDVPKDILAEIRSFHPDSGV